MLHGPHHQDGARRVAQDVLTNGAEVNDAPQQPSPVRSDHDDLGPVPLGHCTDGRARVPHFHETLDPYGSWVDDQTYGTVWVPSETVVGTGFIPYVSAGHWASSTPMRQARARHGRKRFGSLPSTVCAP